MDVLCIYEGRSERRVSQLTRSTLVSRFGSEARHLIIRAKQSPFREQWGVGRKVANYGNDLATDEFRRAREAEMKQDLVVRGLEEKVAEFKRNVGRLLSCRCGFACMVILMIYRDRKRR